jgi:hypothetical protein
MFQKEELEHQHYFIALILWYISYVCEFVTRQLSSMSRSHPLARETTGNSVIEIV